MKRPKGDTYFEFFQDIPQSSDYLNDIEIQDEYESPTDSDSGGLSTEQVSLIARDSLRDARKSRSRQESSPGQTSSPQGA